MRAIRATSILILAIAAFWSLRLAWADRLSRSVQLAGRERAARWAPWSAAVRERLAEKRDETGGDPVPDLEAVAALEPANARGFERLGQRAEFAGKRELAERSLVHAAELSRLYQPRYLLAQYYFRRGDAAGWDLWSRQAFDAAPGDVVPLIALAARMTPNPARLAARAVALKPAAGRQFLFYMVKERQTAAAAELAYHLAESGGSAEVPPLLGFCEQSLADGAVAPAERVWNALCRRGLLPYSQLDRASPVTNPHFAYRPLGSAFDWHEEEKLTWQYAALRRGASYRVVLDEGDAPTWKLYYPASGGWRELTQASPFRAPAEVVRLALPRRVRGIRLELVP